MKNYYDILGVDEKATSADITKAFKDLAKEVPS
jgi:DnaJ-class molecular chaperone